MVPLTPKFEVFVDQNASIIPTPGNSYKDLYVKININQNLYETIGYNETEDEFGQLIVNAPESDLYAPEYNIELYVDFKSETQNEPYTKNDIIKVSAEEEIQIGENSVFIFP